MQVTLTGKIADIFPEENITDRFTKRVLWLEIPAEGGQRGPNIVELELHNSDTTQADRFTVGNQIEATIDIRGRKYTRKNRSEAVANTLKVTGLKLAGPAKKQLFKD